MLWEKATHRCYRNNARMRHTLCTWRDRLTHRALYRRAYITGKQRNVQLHTKKAVAIIQWFNNTIIGTVGARDDQLRLIGETIWSSRHALHQLHHSPGTGTPPQLPVTTDNNMSQWDLCTRRNTHVTAVGTQPHDERHSDWHLAMCHSNWHLTTHHSDWHLATTHGSRWMTFSHTTHGSQLITSSHTTHVSVTDI